MAQIKSELDEFLGPRVERAVAEEQPAATRLGIVVGGSLSKGLDVKLDRTADIESTAVGRYVVVEGNSRRFFSMITDIGLDATDPRIAKLPPDTSDDFTREVMLGTSTFGMLHLAPMLMLEAGAAEPKPVKTVPGHFAPVVEATSQDVNLIFGDERTPGYFHVGEPLDMDGIRIYLDLKRFAERSSGVFGKSGTGKTFLTRMLLAGIVKENVAVNLVFDMHNEYGWKSQTESRSEVKGLRQLFPASKVAVATLDAESSQRRGSRVDFVVQIGYDQIEPEDVDKLKKIMQLTDVQVGALYTLYR
ncbi:MAG: helicase HerA domain-containing protein, partial [Anaerolineae bacterium]